MTERESGSVGWSEVQLREVATEYLSGGTPSTNDVRFWDGDIAWTTSAPIADEAVMLDQGQRSITKEGLANSATHLVPAGNLLVGTRVGVGKAVVNLIDIAVSQDLTGVILNAESVDALFLAYQFKTARVRAFFGGRMRGTTIQGVSRFDLERLPVYLPSLAEQRAIARVLRAVQTAREARQHEVALERERKAALMEYLFTHGPRGESTKQTPIGEMPESWEVVTLEDVVVEFVSGGTPSTTKADYWDGDIPWTTSAPIHEEDSTVSKGQRFITRKGLDNSATHLVPMGELLIGTRVGVGKAVVNLVSIAISQDLTGAVIDRIAATSQFLAYQFKTTRVQRFLHARNRGTTIRGIPRLDLQMLPLVRPSLPEQDLIVGVLNTCSTKIAVLEREIALFDELFRALLDALMTGRVSVTGLIE